MGMRSGNVKNEVHSGMRVTRLYSQERKLALISLVVFVATLSLMIANDLLNKIGLPYFSYSYILSIVGSYGPMLLLLLPIIYALKGLKHDPFWLIGVFLFAVVWFVLFEDLFLIPPVISDLILHNQMMTKYRVYKSQLTTLIKAEQT